MAKWSWGAECEQRWLRSSGNMRLSTYRTVSTGWSSGLVMLVRVDSIRDSQDERTDEGCNPEDLGLDGCGSNCSSPGSFGGRARRIVGQ